MPGIGLFAVLHRLNWTPPLKNYYLTMGFEKIERSLNYYHITLDPKAQSRILLEAATSYGIIKVNLGRCSSIYASYYYHSGWHFVSGRRQLSQNTL